MLIAAGLLGLAAGISWVQPSARAVVGDLLGLPPDRFVRTMIAVGHPSEAALRPKSAPGEARLPAAETVFEERWPQGDPPRFGDGERIGLDDRRPRSPGPLALGAYRWLGGGAHESRGRVGPHPVAEGWDVDELDRHSLIDTFLTRRSRRFALGSDLYGSALAFRSASPAVPLDHR